MRSLSGTAAEREAAAGSGANKRSESEGEAGEDPAGERRSSRQVKLEDQKSNEKQEQNNAPTCAGDSGRRTPEGREVGNLL